MKRAMFSTLVLGAVIGAGGGHTAHADYCNNNWGTWAQPIPVYLNENMAADICSVTNCSSISQIEATVRTVLTEYFDASGGTIRFDYRGTTATPAGQNVPGAIHLYSLDCDGSTLGIAVANGDASTPYGRVRICRSNAGGVIDWNTYLNGSGYSFQAVLAHELGHTIGMGHLEDCNPAPAPNNSVMTQYYYQGGSPHLQRTDLDFLRDVYGPAPATTISRRTSADGLVWTEQPNSVPVSFANVRGRLAASNTAGAGSDLLVGYLTDDGAASIVRVRKHNGTSWSSVASFVTVATYAPGVAKASNSELYVTYQYIDDLDQHTQRVYAKKTLDGGATWGPQIELSTPETRTRNAGVATTYDRASDRFVTMWLGSGADDGAILYRVEGSAAPYVLVDQTGVPVRASDTPSFACGDAAVTGADNCLLAWANAESWSRTVRWSQFYVSGDQLVFPGTTKTHGYVTAGSPTVAYATGTAAATSYVWHLALSQGGTTMYTWRKVGPSAVGFVDQRSFSESPKPSLPIAGAIDNGTRFTLVTDQS